jgi:hypothetical protein
VHTSLSTIQSVQAELRFVSNGVGQSGIAGDIQKGATLHFELIG